MRFPARRNFLVLLFLILSTFYILPSIFPIHAQQSPTTSPDYSTQQIPPNLHNYTQQVLLDLSSGLVCQLVGIDPSGPDPITGEPKKCLGYDLTGKLGFISPSTDSTGSLQAGSGQVGGAIGLMGNLIGVLYTPPVSSGDYFRYLADNFGLVKPAYAQTGIGFEGLKPLLGVWTVMRNMAYLILVLVFLVIGVAIMLRVRIDPRTVMNIQNQIPKILITLILVTFSYAIAGFLIDFMYLMIYLFFNLLSNTGVNLGSFSPVNLQGQNTLEAAGGLGGINEIVSTPANSIREAIKSLLGIETDFNRTFNPFAPATDLLTGAKLTVGNTIITLIGWAAGVGTFFKVASITAPQFTTPFVGDFVNIIIGTGKFATAAGAGGLAYTSTQVLLRDFFPFLLAYLIILIAVLWALFRLWFQLIMAYIFILLDVAFAPLWILTGALPGAGLGFGSWVRDILANLSVFPTTIGMFLLGKIFMENFQKPPVGTVPFVPPLIGNPGEPSAIGALIGLGIIFLTPQVANMVRDAFKAPPFKYGFAIGQALGAGAGTVGGPISMAKGVGTQALTFGLASKIQNVIPFFKGK